MSPARMYSLARSHHRRDIRPAWCWTAPATSSGPASCAGGRLVERPVERVDDAGEPLLRARVARPCAVTPGSGRTGVTTVMLVLHRVEHHHQRRADQDRVGNADRIGIGRPAAPPSAAPCRSRDSRTRRPPSAAARPAARCGFRRSARAARRAAARRRARRRRRSLRALRLISACAPLRAPDQVGIEADDRIAAAHRAALDRLEQEAHRPAAGELQERRDRRFEIGDQRGPHHLRLAARRSARRRRRPAARSAWRVSCGRSACCRR